MDKKTKRISALLIWASVLTLFLTMGAGALGRFLLIGDSQLTSTEGFYYAVKVIPLGILFAAISWYSVAWGRRNRRKPNVVVGMIFGVLVTLMGIMGILGHSEYYTDYSYMAELGEMVGFEFPDSGKLVAIKATKENQPAGNKIYIELDAVVRFSDEDAKMVEDRIASDPRFVTELSIEAQTAIPTLYSYTYKSSQYDSYMLYSVDSGSFNDPAEGDRSFIYFLYVRDENAMVIYKYTLNGLTEEA